MHPTVHSGDFIYLLASFQDLYGLIMGDGDGFGMFEAEELTVDLEICSLALEVLFKF